MLEGREENEQIGPSSLVRDKQRPKDHILAHRLTHPATQKEPRRNANKKRTVTERRRLMLESNTRLPESIAREKEKCNERREDSDHDHCKICRRDEVLDQTSEVG